MSTLELLIGPVAAVLGALVLTVFAPKGERLFTALWCAGVYVSASALFLGAILMGWI